MILFGIWILVLGVFKLIEFRRAGRKEGTTSSQHGAYTLGYTHPTMANNNGKLARKRMQISCKFRLSSDWGLQPDPMKSESVVIADQQAAVNTFSGLVHTARQGSKVGNYRTSILSREIEIGDEA